MAARVVPEHTSSYKRPPYCRDIPVGQVDALMLNAVPSGVPAALMVGDAFALASVIWAHGTAYQGDRIAFSAGEYNERWRRLRVPIYRPGVWVPAKGDQPQRNVSYYIYFHDERLSSATIYPVFCCDNGCEVVQLPCCALLNGCRCLKFEMHLEEEAKRWRRESTIACCIGPRLFPKNAVYYLTYVASNRYPAAEEIHRAMNLALREEHRAELPVRERLPAEGCCCCVPNRLLRPDFPEPLPGPPYGQVMARDLRSA